MLRQSITLSVGAKRLNNPHMLTFVLEFQQMICCTCLSRYGSTAMACLGSVRIEINKQTNKHPPVAKCTISEPWRFETHNSVHHVPWRTVSPSNKSILTSISRLGQRIKMITPTLIHAYSLAMCKSWYSGVCLSSKSRYGTNMGETRISNFRYPFRFPWPVFSELRTRPRYHGF